MSKTGDYTHKARSASVRSPYKPQSASLYEWSKEYYESQWRHAIKTLLLGKGKAALITTYGRPENATHLEWWPMYVAEDAVFIQDPLFFMID